MTSERRKAAVQARGRLYKSLRDDFISAGFDEVETPCMVPAPGMEPHIRAFEVPFVPETPDGRAQTLYLHSSPEYAMKRLLAEGFERIFQLCKVFRNGEVAALHNPEFSMLEFYRAQADYHAIMADLERLVPRAAEAVAGRSTLQVGGREIRLDGFERLTVREAMRSRTGVDIAAHPEPDDLRAAFEARGFRFGGPRSWDDLFFQVFLEAVEPTLGLERPTFLIEYPARMASLARLKPDDPSVAERFELYIAGLELANGFSELTDAVEQRRRLVEEQELRRGEGKPVYPLDERFIEAVGRMPPCSGVALGLDRLLMLLIGAGQIDEVLLFPAREFFTAGGT